MICKNCGHEIPNEHKFCDYCGKPLDVDFCGVNPPAPQPPQKNKKTGLIAALVTGAIALVVATVFIVLGVTGFFGKDSKDDSSKNREEQEDVQNEENENSADKENDDKENDGEVGKKPADGTFKIGGIGPLTGDADVFGYSVKYGAELAVQEINASGGINGYQIEFMMSDDEYDAEKSVQAYEDLEEWGMQMLMGTVNSLPCVAVSQEAAKDNMFMLTPTASYDESILASDAFFRMCYEDSAQGSASAEYIASNNLASKIGIIFQSDDDYSVGIKDSFVARAKELNLEIVSAQSFTNDSDKDFSAQIQACKTAGADLVFLPIYYTEAALILKAADAADYAPIFFGCDGLDGILTAYGFDTSLAEGLMMLTPFVSDAQDAATVHFVNSFLNAPDDEYSFYTHEECFNQFAAEAYDAIYAIKAAAEKSDINPSMSVEEISEAMKKAMTQITINGVTGTGTTWMANGEPIKEPKAVVIRNGKYVEP